MDQKQFVRAVRSRTARIAAAASAARGKGNGGVVGAARSYLRRLDLSAFGTRDETMFRRALDRCTRRLVKHLPPPARHWGLARKLLNIYLRDCLYCTYLSASFKLERAERLLEVPLDSITARGLKRAAGRAALPVWPGVKHLSPEVSAGFQSFAAELARREGFARVHLDAVYWSVGRDS